MTKKTTNDLIEFAKKSGIARALELDALQEAVIRDQHTVENKLEGVAALEWQRENILAHMHYALERDDIDAIQESIAEWQVWLDEIPPEVKSTLFKTLARIESYVERYNKNEDDAG